MSMAYTEDRTAPRGAFHALTRRAAALRAAMAAARARRAAYRRTFAELDQLSDRELSDIGIARCDIHRLAREEYAKDLTQ